MSVFVNRTLNLRKIKLIGFDMDYTLVPYYTREFEKLTHTLALTRLVNAYNYPKILLTQKFDFERAIVGLVVDKRNGNLLQLNRYNKVKSSYHGLREVPFREQNDLYSNIAVDLSDKDFQSLDTSFAISYGVLFSQLVQLKEDGVRIPDYRRLARDIMNTIDELHKNGSLKNIIIKNFGKYVINDPKTAMVLERYKDYGKKLMIITNSDYEYTRELLDFAINPYLKKHASWRDVFDLVITFADKPRFFERDNRFLKIDSESGLMSNYTGSIREGIYQGGSYKRLQDDMGLEGQEILYIGDHIYGDVVSIKKHCAWRTALVLGDLEEEMTGLRNSYGVQCEIDDLMIQKSALERKINEIDILRYEGSPKHYKTVDAFFREMDQLNAKISELIIRYKKYFNPYWGEILRAGSEESLYAEQVEEYACIYMTRVSDLYEYSPRTYFRPVKRIMPHELAVNKEKER